MITDLWSIFSHKSEIIGAGPSATGRQLRRVIAAMLAAWRSSGSRSTRT